MANIEGRVEELNDLSTEVDIYYKKLEPILFYNKDNLIDKQNSDDLICAICYCILKDPLSCSDKINSHSFCKECFDEYLKENTSSKCPTCKSTFKFKINRKISNELDKLLFKCLFQNEGCNDILPYSKYLNHIKNCEYNNLYECMITKNNYEGKEHRKCVYP